MKKRLLALLLVLVMVMGFVPVTARAEGEPAIVDQGTCGTEGNEENVVWVLTDDGKITISGQGAMADYTSNLYVPWYEYQNDITAVEIENGITSIGKNTFNGCANIAAFPVLPDGLVKIGDAAFQGTGITGTITIPSTVTEFGKNVFSQCSNLEGVVFDCSLEELQSQSFYECTSLKSIQLPSGIKKLDREVFRGCTSLETIELPDTLLTIGQTCFSQSGLTSLYLPGSITSFGGMMLSQCVNLAHLEYGNGTTTIPRITSGCSSLVDIIIPATVTAYNDSHMNCNLLTNILYCGTEEQWNSITFSAAAQSRLAGINIVFNYDPTAAALAVNITQQPVSGSYTWGEIASPLEIRAEAEDGVSLSYTWYVNYADSTEGGRALDYSTAFAGGSRVPVYYEDTGTRYYYCAITATKDSVVKNVFSDVAALEITGEKDHIDLPGNGSERSPYLVSSISDLMKLGGYTRAGHTFQDEYIKLNTSITLTGDWTPIGIADGNYNSVSNGQIQGILRPFSGILDGGGNTVTVPESGLPLLGTIGPCTVKNLNIYGQKIVGAGLINHMPIYGTSGIVTVENVKILSGTSTLGSGIVNGGGRSAFIIKIIDCTVENGVTIGYDHNQSGVGSFVGGLCGAVIDCTSYADVYGVNNVGGLVGSRGQSMSAFQVSNSQFHGTVNATGKNVGGIVGRGYSSPSAPNSSGVDIQNCLCDGAITGGSNVGGILGAEDGVDQFWDNGPLTIRGNTFTGTVSGSSRVGGIAGYIRALNRYVYVENNDFSGCTGADKEIGFVTHIDTSAVSFGMHDGTFYFNTANYNTYTEDDWAAIYAVVDADWADTNRTKNNSIAKPNHNRTDDPLGVGGGEVVITDLIITGYKEEYMVGEEFTTAGMSITAKYSDDSTVDVDLAEVSFTGFSSTAAGVKTITASWGGFSKQFDVTVIAPAGETIKVKLTVLGDTLHDMGENDPGHGLWLGGLTTWLPETEYEIDANQNTVWDLITTAFDADDSLSLEHSFNTSYNSEYISAVQKGDVKLTEKDNHPNSGWMYTLNGANTHVQVGVSLLHLAEGDSIILHWCDNYVADEAAGAAQGQDKQAAMAVEALIDAIGTPVTLESEDAIVAARTAYDALNDNAKSYVDPDCYAILTAAEAALAELKASAQRVADVIAAINALPAADELTLNDEAAVAAARAAYDALSEAEQAQVTNLAALEAAEAKIEQLEAEQDQQAASAADQVIAALPAADAITLDDAAAVAEARAAYDALTPEQQALVNNYDALLAAEAKIAELQEQAASAQRVAEATAAIDALPAADEVTLADEAAVIAARMAYDALSDAEKAQVSADKLIAAEAKIAELKAQQSSEEKINDATEKINALPAADAVTLADEAAIAAARAAYDALTDAEKAQVDASALVAAEARLAALKFGTVKPEVKAANAKNGKIELTITPVAGAVKYKIYVSEKADGAYKEAATVTEPKYTYNGTPGQQYFFKVVAVNGAGVESAESAVVGQFRLPAQVTGLKVKSKKKKEVTLTWKKVTGAKKYVIYMSKNGKTGWKKIGTVKTNKFTYKKAPAGKKMYFRVQAITANGKKGEFSKAVSVKVKK